MQYIFAKDLPVKAYLALAVLLSASGPFFACQLNLALFKDWHFLLLFVSSVLLMGALGFFVSLPFAFVFLAPLYYLRAKLNGAPFHTGDRVRILIGPHSDRVAEVYSVWSERSQVRVDLDAQMKKDVTDAFSFTQVCRDSPA